MKPQSIRDQTGVRRSELGEPAQRPDDLRLRPPFPRARSIPRLQVIRRLKDASDADVIALIAPAGYGKTTVLAQWALDDPRPFAWLTVDHSDDDPSKLLFDIAGALRVAGLLSEDAFGPGFAGVSALPRAIAQLIAGMTHRDDGVVVVLDQVENLTTREARDVIAELVLRIPGRIQVAIASRREVNLPLTSWRAEAKLLELGPGDLRMDNQEGAAMLRGLGVPRDLQDEFVSRTEGWPVALYLGALAHRSGLSPPVPTGDDRYLADYMREQLLDEMDPALKDFLTRSSLLRELSGPLCDALLDATGSASILEWLERDQFPIVPLDHTRTWYRMHPLVRELLLAELTHSEPDLVPELHRRAAAWLERHDDLEEALFHSQAAEDTPTVARLIGEIGRLTFATGQSETVIGWLNWLELAGAIHDYPDLAGLGGLVFALIGDTLRSDRWTDAVMTERADTSSALVHLVRALQCRGGMAQVRADAARASALLPPGSTWRPAVLLVQALPNIWEGDLETAEPLLSESVQLGLRHEASLTTSFAMAERSVISTARGDWEDAEGHALDSVALCESRGLVGYATSGLGYAMASRCATRKGNGEGGLKFAAAASQTRPVLSVTLPGVSVQTLLETAAAFIELGDLSGARLAMREAEDILIVREDLGNLGKKLADMRDSLQTLSRAIAGSFSLTRAELRVLTYLSSHLSFPEIGERLYISRHTVKTHAMSIYRKLGASSRSEAVAKATAAGFLVE